MKDEKARLALRNHDHRKSWNEANGEGDWERMKQYGDDIIQKFKKRQKAKKRYDSWKKAYLEANK